MLPFDNISSDQETDYFSDGLTEELIARLSLVSEIELISRWASMQYKGASRTCMPSAMNWAPATSSAAVYVAFRTRSESQSSSWMSPPIDRLWGNTYKGKLDDIFDIQEQVAQQIVEALKLKLSFSEKVSLTKRQTVNAQAYDLYLRGQAYLYRLTKRGIEYAIQLFEKAIELDPRYAAAYAAVPRAYGQMFGWFAREDQYRDQAQEFSFKALMYDNNLARSVYGDGAVLFHLGKIRGGIGLGRKAIELDPDDFIAHWTLGRIQFSTANPSRPTRSSGE